MTDQQRVQGSWALVSGERNGSPIPEELAKKVTLVFGGDKLTTKTATGDLVTKFKLYSEKEPAEIDVDVGGEIGRGIYQLTGDDLKILHGEVGTPRPTEFATKAGSGLTMLVLRRVITSVGR
jgi:uncharacterized protein (TIGR03067 family)